MSLTVIVISFPQFQTSFGFQPVPLYTPPSEGGHAHVSSNGSSIGGGAPSPPYTPPIQSSPTYVPPLSSKFSVSTQPGLCRILHIPTVRDSGNDPASAINAADNNMYTAWTQNTISPWIQFHLGTQKVLCNIDIAWHNGSTRSNFFTIAISKDGIYFQTVYNGRSTGSTSWFERYNLSGSPANYIQITINGNSMNSFVGINEVRINGY